LGSTDDARRGNGDGSVIADAGPDSAVPVDAQTSFVLEAESPSFTTSADGVSSWAVETTLAGYSGTGYVTASPTNGSPCAELDVTCGAVSTYNFQVTVAGTYRVTLRHHSPNGCCDSVFWALGLTSEVDDFQPDTVATWTDDTSPQDVTLTAGNKSLVMRIREPGTHVDLIRIELQ
jgi:hypothetical protein